MSNQLLIDKKTFTIFLLAGLSVLVIFGTSQIVSNQIHPDQTESTASTSTQPDIQVAPTNGSESTTTSPQQTSNPSTNNQGVDQSGQPNLQPAASNQDVSNY
ncbi:MAG TPA: hypothetical protein VLE72_02205 [Candidatus Saccharimonadales bacterium]|nr:hypothetical protein [Candidatus Saccharimonadales bacterium]